MAPQSKLSPTPAELLLRQYELSEERRKYFGSQFMQTTGGVIAIFSLLVGLLGGKPEIAAFLRAVLVIGGIAFVLLAYLGYRLGKRQDDCEETMEKIESTLVGMGYPFVAEMPKGAKQFGARTAIVIFLVLVGLFLVVSGFTEWWIKP